MWFACFAPIAMAARIGVKGVEGKAARKIEAVSSFHARAQRTVRRVVLPAALPKVLIARVRAAAYRVDGPAARMLQ